MNKIRHWLIHKLGGSIETPKIIEPTQVIYTAKPIQLACRMSCHNEVPKEMVMRRLAGQLAEAIIRDNLVVMEAEDGPEPLTKTVKALVYVMPPGYHEYYQTF